MFLTLDGNTKGIQHISKFHENILFCSSGGGETLVKEKKLLNCYKETLHRFLCVGRLLVRINCWVENCLHA